MRVVVLIITLALIAAACASTAETEGPPEINFGRDICVQCGMTIDDGRFVAAYRLEDGTENKFDDLGGLLIHGREHGELATAQIWVADFETEEWLDATSAFFVPTLSVTSPMGHDLLAFGDEARAVRFAEDVDGDVINWEVARDLPVVDGLVGHHHDSEQADHDGSDHDG